MLLHVKLIKLLKSCPLLNQFLEVGFWKLVKFVVMLVTKHEFQTYFGLRQI